MSKNIAFSISKHYFIYFNTPLYSTSNIKSFIFFTTLLKYYLFIIYNSFFFFKHLFLSLSLCVSLFSKQKQPIHPLWPPPATTYSMSPPSPPKPPPITNPQPTIESVNPYPLREVSLERDRQPTTQPMASTHSITYNKPLQSTTESINSHPQPKATESTQTHKST